MSSKMTGIVNVDVALPCQFNGRLMEKRSRQEAIKIKCFTYSCFMNKNERFESDSLLGP